MKNYLLALLILITFNIGFATEELHRTGLLICDPRLYSAMKEVTSIPLEEPLLPAIDLSSEMPPVGNQGMQGSCVGWATSYYHWTHNQYKEFGWDVTQPQNQYSPSFIYNQINGGGDNGAYFIDACKFLIDHGNANMSLCPYDEDDYTSWPSETAYVFATPYRGDTSYFIDAGSDPGIDLIKARLNLGYTVCLGIFVWGNFDNINSYDTVYTIATRTGTNRGGHAITIVGYDDTKATVDGTGAFRFVNSWGTFWGHSGYAWMSYQAVKNNLLSARQAYYITARNSYSPSYRVRLKITHNARTRIGIRLGFGPTSTSRHTKNFFDFYQPTVSDRAFPNNNMVFDMSDGVSYLPNDSIVFCRCIDTQSDSKTGTIDYFAEDIIGGTSRISTDPPVSIPDYNVAVYAQIPSVPPLGRWVLRESIPTQIPGKYVKDGGSSVKVENDLFAFRGNKSHEFYQYSSGSWTLKESLQFNYKPGTLTLNKKKVGKGASLCYDGDSIIYAIKSNGTRELWGYNTKTSAWTAKAFVPPVKGFKGGSALVFYNGKLYMLAGGLRPDSSNFFVYDPTADTINGLPWSPLLKAPVTPNNKAWKDGSSLTIIDNIVYALKGGDKYNIFYAYNILTNTWTEKESIPQFNPILGKKNKIKDGAAIAAIDSVIYAIKGGGKTEFWKYVAGTWIPCELIPTLSTKSVPKTGAALASNDSGVYLMKGNNTPELWQYVPYVSAYSTERRVNSNLGGQDFSLAKANTVLPTTANVEKSFSFTNKIIHYSVPIFGRASIKLYNMNGNLIETLHDGYLVAGNYTNTLTTKNIASGVYILKLEGDTNRASVKLIVR